MGVEISRQTNLFMELVVEITNAPKQQQKIIPTEFINQTKFIRSTQQQKKKKQNIMSIIYKTIQGRKKKPNYS
jgi:hypothetical protein